MPNILLRDFDLPTATLFPATLPPATVHIWRVDLDLAAPALGACHAMLSGDECERAARYRQSRDRYRFVAGRGILRQLLAHYVGHTPAQIKLQYSPYGKPYLTLPDVQLQFNVSHSGGKALFAFSRQRAVGIDIEATRDDIEFAALTQTAFSPAEQVEWLALPGTLKKQGFYHAWTRKEAFIKAIGHGLNFPLCDFDVSLHPARPAALLAVRSPHFAQRDWELCDVPVAPGYLAALCIHNTAAKITIE